MMRGAPGVLCIEREPLNILREVAIAGWSERAVDARSRIRRRIALIYWRRVIKRQRTRDAPAIRARRIDIAVGVRGIRCELFRRSRERATEHRFVNKVDPELQRVVAPDMTQVVANLIFF